MFVTNLSWLEGLILNSNSWNVNLYDKFASKWIVYSSKKFWLISNASNIVNSKSFCDKFCLETCCLHFMKQGLISSKLIWNVRIFVTNLSQNIISHKFISQYTICSWQICLYYQDWYSIQTAEKLIFMTNLSRSELYTHPKSFVLLTLISLYFKLPVKSRKMIWSSSNFQRMFSLPITVVSVKDR